VTERYELIEAEKDTMTDTGERKYTITTMGEWLGVSTSGYDAWRDRPESVTAQRRAYLALLVRTSFKMSDETYGYRRVHAELVRWGEPCTPELVRGIMRELDLVPCQPRPWRHGVTDADPTAYPIPDLVNRDVTATRPGEKMVGDITCIPTWEGWVYLATVIDCYGKGVIGWAMDDNYKPRSSRKRSGWPPATLTCHPRRSSTPTAAATTPPSNSAEPWNRWESDAPSAAPGSASTTP
jgi:putative transposase